MRLKIIFSGSRRAEIGVLQLRKHLAVSKNPPRTHTTHQNTTAGKDSRTSPSRSAEPTAHIFAWNPERTGGGRPCMSHKKKPTCVCSETLKPTMRLKKVRLKGEFVKIQFAILSARQFQKCVVQRKMCSLNFFVFQLNFRRKWVWEMGNGKWAI